MNDFGEATYLPNQSRGGYIVSAIPVDLLVFTMVCRAYRLARR